MASMVMARPPTAVAADGVAPSELGRADRAPRADVCLFTCVNDILKGNITLFMILYTYRRVI